MISLYMYGYDEYSFNYLIEFPGSQTAWSPLPWEGMVDSLHVSPVCNHYQWNFKFPLISYYCIHQKLNHFFKRTTKVRHCTSVMTVFCGKIWYLMIKFYFLYRSADGPECLVTNSVFMGESINLGEPSVIRGNGMVKTYPRAVPLKMA